MHGGWSGCDKRDLGDGDGGSDYGYGGGIRHSLCVVDCGDGAWSGGCYGWGGYYRRDNGSGLGDCYVAGGSWGRGCSRQRVCAYCWGGHKGNGCWDSGDDAWVLRDRGSADTGKVGQCGLDFLSIGTPGLNARDDCRGEIRRWAEARDVRIGIALRHHRQPGIETGWQNRWARCVSRRWALSCRRG